MHVSNSWFPSKMKIQACYIGVTVPVCFNFKTQYMDAKQLLFSLFACKVSQSRCWYTWLFFCLFERMTGVKKFSSTGLDSLFVIVLFQIQRLTDGYDARETDGSRRGEERDAWKQLPQYLRNDDGNVFGTLPGQLSLPVVSNHVTAYPNASCVLPINIQIHTRCANLKVVRATTLEISQLSSTLMQSHALINFELDQILMRVKERFRSFDRWWELHESRIESSRGKRFPSHYPNEEEQKEKILLRIIDKWQME